MFRVVVEEAARTPAMDASAYDFRRGARRTNHDRFLFSFRIFQVAVEEAGRTPVIEVDASCF